MGLREYLEYEERVYRAERGLYSRMTATELRRALDEVQQALVNRLAECRPGREGLVSGEGQTQDEHPTRRIFDGDRWWTVDEHGVLREDALC